MCGHCEASVKKALEKLDGVEEAVVSHTSGTAELKLSAPVDDAAIQKAIESFRVSPQHKEELRALKIGGRNQK